MPHVLIIEDDDAIRRALSHSLQRLQHAVTTVGRGSDGLIAAMENSPDVVTLDLGLPDMDGMQVLKMLRAAVDVPIIVATARDGEQQIVRALELGADDYMVKPFSAEHMHARITAVLRRGSDSRKQTRVIRVGELVIDLNAHHVTLEGRPVEVRPKEFRLLAYLAEHAGRVVSKEELLAEIWDRAFGATEKTVDVHLSWLRRRLGETAAEPRYLQSVRGVGVKLVEPPA
ncbi:response regulator transcription factor [Streptomyces sp. TRM70350]|uniref:response regulator transcription factor n=1 Tax=Streptomyces sp. TRM70350 TaxID=2856165 RepID=UPI001C436C2A|nr:response regulator transcription factor [Streptomyces sp. TRM70350]MBV7699432.1 response regulator transcription factor [Streptomyces sp. TRM70350]